MNDYLRIACQQVREDIVTMIHHAGSGHPGGSLSAVELLVALYQGGVLKHDASNPAWDGRDRFILSKGHVAPVLYSVLARSGYFSVDELSTLRELGSILQGHPHMECTPGLDCSSGSLGQGLSIANGLAMAFKKRSLSNRVYCLMGDGELQEGQIWEAAMTSAHFKLDNLCAIVDYNHVQLDGTTEEIKDLGDLQMKWASFGFHVIDIDGHQMEEVLGAYAEAMTVKGKPSVIIANTVKGKGVSFMENKCEWHGQAPNAGQWLAALTEILS
ncbi:transketolase [Paenibacillus sp. FSL R10-2734]|uniref:transketolase n=1 Tax=Paenibacillus sp. FSL R10-2734 TaxID=2954691 RepID=UPI0030DBDF7C